jgi:hypothetical protein
MKPDVSNMTRVYRLGYIIFGLTYPMGDLGLARGASDCQVLGLFGMLDARILCMIWRRLMHVDVQWSGVEKIWNASHCNRRIILCCILVNYYTILATSQSDIL